MSAKNITVNGVMINGRMVVSQRQFQSQNTNYVIKGEFDLDGEQIILPKNSKIIFSSGGKLTNGKLFGNESDLTADQGKHIFSKIIIDGTWRVENIYSNWFDFGEDVAWNTKYMQNLCNLTSGNHRGDIYISEGVYKVNVTNKNSSCLNVNSNTNITIDGSIELQPCDKRFYGILRIVDVHDVKISGKGMIIGDIEHHYGDTGEWGMGVDIWSSKNIMIENITIKNCWGDCIYLGQSKEVKESYSENVVIDNVTCTSSRRQGLSIIAGMNVLVKNSKFTDIGSIKYAPPGAGLDIEPNHYGETIVNNITISHCVFRNNYNGKDFSSYNLDKTASININHCTFEGGLVIHDKGYNIVFNHCDINNIYINRQDTGNIVFKNSTLRKNPPQHLLVMKIIRVENCEYPQKRKSWWDFLKR